MQVGSVELVFEEDIVENVQWEEQVRTLLSATEGTFVCNRKFGIRSDIIDQPESASKSLYSAEVYDKMELFIPQLSVEDIRFRVDGETLYPTIYLVENEEYEDAVSEYDTEDGEVGEEDEYERD